MRIRFLALVSTFLAAACGGSKGADGASGTSTLVAIAPEPSGANCASGGSRVTSGPDRNGNGVLDPAEVSATSYLCNGSQGPSTTWTTVTGPVAAQPNHGYIAAADAGQVVITLPASPRFGDLVRVSGLGLGGWRIAQNDGQTVNVHGLGQDGGDRWVPRTLSRLDPGGVVYVPPSWKGVASSADGTRLLAVEGNAFGVISSTLWTSTDGGGTWTPGTDQRVWTAVAMSADGRQLAASTYGSYLYVSPDGGATWSAGGSPRRIWSTLASSADGATLIAGALDDAYVSRDHGATWQAQGFATRIVNVATSPDGSRLYAAAYSGPLHAWNASTGWRTAAGGTHGWMALAQVGATGLVVAAMGEPILFSSDEGESWVGSGPPASWYGLAASADGTQVTAVAAGVGGERYKTSDGGATFTVARTGIPWQAVASSVAGDRLVAVPVDGKPQTSASWTTVGTSGSISGALYDAIELQALDAGRFTVLSHEGALVIQ